MHGGSCACSVSRYRSVFRDSSAGRSHAVRPVSCSTEQHIPLDQELTTTGDIGDRVEGGGTGLPFSQNHRLYTITASGVARSTSMWSREGWSPLQRWVLWSRMKIGNTIGCSP
jgi:hypothetical protein